MASTTYSDTDFAAPLVPAESLKRWSVAEYDQMLAHGVLAEDAPYELIEGWLVLKMTHNPPHDNAVDYLNEVFVKALSPRWRCRTQSTIELSDSKPEPDIAIVLGPRTRYLHAPPTSNEIGLLIEVSDSTLAKDRGLKMRAYARAGIPQYWIVNLGQRQVEVLSEPTTQDGEPRFTKQQVLRPGEALLAHLPGEEPIALAIDELFPVSG